MLKGRSKIQLFDAATGKKVLEQRDSNMVTNALDIIANLKDEAGLFRWWRYSIMSGNTDTADRLGVAGQWMMLPMYQKALGGVLLWDANITEDPSIVVPPPGVYEVGHAGGAYGGSDIYRGSYNENESGSISGGWRHVWDFDTDKANGTIKCLSLTSWHGGNIGYHGCFEGDDQYALYNYFWFHRDNIHRTCDAGSGGVPLPGSGWGTSLYLRNMGDGTLRLYRRNQTQVWYVDISDPTKLSILDGGLKCGETVFLPITPINDRSAMYVYQNQIHDIGMSVANQLVHKIYSLEGEEISSKVINLPFSYVNTYHPIPAVYRDGYYYCIPHNDVNIIKVDAQGQQVGSFPFLRAATDQARGAVINEYNNEILFSVYTGDQTCYLPVAVNGRDETAFRAINNSSFRNISHNSVTSGPYPQYVKTDDPDSLFVYFGQLGENITPLVNTGYLATINNLQTPITKTAAQTMKITYEIYDE